MPMQRVGQPSPVIGQEYLEMLCLKQPVAAAQTEPGADSCGLQMSKQVLPSKK